MGEGLHFLDIIFFAMIAGFIFLRLRGVLGKRTGNERHRPNPYTGPGEGKRAEDKVVALPDLDRRDQATRQAEARAEPAASGPADQALAAIRRADQRFQAGEFLSGARAAYEMIIEAFAKGDRASLRTLLSDEVFANFEQAIAERESARHQLKTKIVKVHGAEIEEASLHGRTAEITVKYVSGMVSVLRDEHGNVVGDPPREREVTDYWTYARETNARDPNWLLVATRSES
ncbi:MAG: Tim44 domain-containing protein [Alphaproteobacteria bacterium]|nr:Tim44 domain-containing protein [Alphaproteobacteria bacterium]